MAMKATCLVGLDVHARQTHAARLDPVTGEVHVGKLVMAPLEVVGFLERLGPGVCAAWTGAHLKWLRALVPDDACGRAVFADDLAAVELLSGRRASLLAALEQQVPDCSHAAVIARLRCFRGIDTLSAAGLCAELGDWRRFPAPARISGFVGIVPSEHTSDSKRRQGSITKAGPGHARRLLRRGRPALPHAAAHRPRARAPPSRPGRARDRDRLARPTAPARALAAPAPAAPQALGRGRHRRRPRTRRVPLGGRHA